MLTFSSLSLSQKKCVVALIEAQPTLMQTGHVTFKDVNAITSSLTAARDSGAPKIGYPNWLFASNKISRGLYQLPLPTPEDLSAFKQSVSSASKPTKPKKTSPINGKLQTLLKTSATDADVEAFNQICRDNGIAV